MTTTATLAWMAALILAVTSAYTSMLLAVPAVANGAELLMPDFALSLPTGNWSTVQTQQDGSKYALRSFSETHSIAAFSHYEDRSRGFSRDSLAEWNREGRNPYAWDQYYLIQEVMDGMEHSANARSDVRIKRFEWQFLPEGTNPELCAKYEMVADHIVSQGRRLIAEELGMVCLIAKFGIVVVFSYIEQRSPAEAPLNGFAEEAKYYLDSLKIN